ncbi:MAG: CCA tRNA nucleotidyltransferase [Planctomycetes bacterium]|nr:CCA tRNA nucleotidyltransferase [Planctomycetota bacterium]
MPRVPTMQDLSSDLARGARLIAARVASAGARAWIVGGAPRDLALGLAPTEIDMASRLEPERIMELFARTTPLGRAFGTVIVHEGGVDVEHTTFRTEATYSDARRPDAVRFGASVEEDARRRDFTCNAIYLDPLTDEVGDPTGGLADLARRRLACVGDARERFREDALRPLRMARFAGGLGLEPAPETAAAARAEAAGLAGVSRERVLRELAGIFRRRGAAVAVGWMRRCELLDPALPGSTRLAGGERRERALAALPEPAGLERGLALLLGPAPEGLEDLELSRALLGGLRTSRATALAVEDAWRCAAAMRAEPRPGRATRIRWMRRPGFEVALAWLGAWGAADGSDAARWRELAAERARLAPGEIEPARLLESADLALHGIGPGPRYGALLRELETEQLEERVRTRAEALRWLAQRAPRA